MYNHYHLIMINYKYNQNRKYRLLDSLVVECWLRVREVPSSIPSQGPRHTKEVIKMVKHINKYSVKLFKRATHSVYYS